MDKNDFVVVCFNSVLLFFLECAAFSLYLCQHFSSLRHGLFSALFLLFFFYYLSLTVFMNIRESEKKKQEVDEKEEKNETEKIRIFLTKRFWQLYILNYILWCDIVSDSTVRIVKKRERDWEWQRKKKKIK